MVRAVGLIVFYAACHRDAAGSHDLLDAVGLAEGDEGVDLRLGPGDS